MSSSTPSYWCHRCTQFITISPNSAAAAVTCPHCRTGFVESLPSSSATATRRRRRDRSPFNPVIVLRDRIEEHSRTFHLYYDDDDGDDVAGSGSGTGLRPVPAPVSDLLMGSGFDRLLDQLSTIDIGAAAPSVNPPASKSAIEALPTVFVSGSHVSTHCAVCTEEFEVGNEAKEMPCKHMYHYECIVPWLSIRNTCPVCRAALPGSEETGLVEPSPIGLTIWRLPGGGYAVGRWRGGVERERELPAVYTEMDGGGFGEGPRRVSWGSRSSRTRNLGGFSSAFRGFESFFGRFRAERSSGPMIDRSRSSGFARRRR